MRTPFQTPAGMLYRPKWTNIPNRAARNQSVRDEGAACAVSLMPLRFTAPGPTTSAALSRHRACFAPGRVAPIREG